MLFFAKIGNSKGISFNVQNRLQNILRILRPKDPPLVGIDLTSTVVKVLDLNETDGQIQLENYAVVPFATHAVLEKEIKDAASVSATIKQALEYAKVKNKAAVIAVPSSSVITATLQMPADLSEEDLEGQVEVEAHKFVPYPLNEVSLDFEILGSSKHQIGLLDVLVVASRRDYVESRVDVVEDAGLQVKVVEVESTALERVNILFERDTTITAIIDIGASTTSLTVLRNGRSIYTRDDLFGGNILTEEIMQHYGLSYTQAGLSKKIGDLPDDYLSNILNPFKEAILQQINRSLQFFYSSSHYTQINQIILAGGCAAIPHLTMFLQEKLHIPCIVANPFKHMRISSHLNTANLHNDAPSLLLCCGLALRGLINGKY